MAIFSKNVILETYFNIGRKDDLCQLEDKACRKSAVIYSIKCDIDNCQKLYIGSTQRFAKVRIGEHLTDFKKCIKKGMVDGRYCREKEKSIDSFTRHMLGHERSWIKSKEGMSGDAIPDRKNMREVTRSSVMMEAGPFQLGTERCSICKWEKYLIWKTPNTMNLKTELFSKCRHKSRLAKPKLLTTEDSDS